MAKKKLRQPGLKFRQGSDPLTRCGVGRREPITEAASVANVCAMMVVHLARKILYGLDVSYRAGLYIVGILMLSLLGDLSVFPRNHYMAQRHNFFNVYLVVHFGWGWTLLFTGTFILVTSYTYSCGNLSVMKNQLSRAVVATGIWYGMTGIFLFVEEKTGVCSGMTSASIMRKDECIRSGNRWKGFDISGHAFLLSWNCLFMIEEARAYLGWERIRDVIRVEERRRLAEADDTVALDDFPATALSKLSFSEFVHLKKHYSTYTPLIRLLFCMMSVLVLMWEIGLVLTAMYFHELIEKVMGCLAAVVLWFVLYRGIYVHPWSPGLPGDGPFSYVTSVFSTTPKTRKNKMAQTHAHGGGYSRKGRWQSRRAVTDGPSFMGMPLYSTKETKNVSHGRIESADQEVNDELNQG